MKIGHIFCVMQVSIFRCDKQMQIQAVNRQAHTKIYTTKIRTWMGMGQVRRPESSAGSLSQGCILAGSPFC